MMRRVGEIAGLVVWGIVWTIVTVTVLGVFAVALVSCGGEG